MTTVNVSPVEQTPASPTPAEQWHLDVDNAVDQFNSDPNAEPVSVLFIDLDNLKALNDDVGHLDGDEVIAETNRILALMRESLRTTPSEDYPNRVLDVVSNHDPEADGTKELPVIKGTVNGKGIEFTPERLGGDEFGALCRTDEEGAIAIANRLRELFDAAVDDSPKSQQLREVGVSISVGVNTLKRGMSSSELKRGADVAMYEDKESHLELNPEKAMVLKGIIDACRDSGIRLRDIPKYAKKLERLAEQARAIVEQVS